MVRSPGGAGIHTALGSDLEPTRFKLLDHGQLLSLSDL